MKSTTDVTESYIYGTIRLSLIARVDAGFAITARGISGATAYFGTGTTRRGRFMAANVPVLVAIDKSVGGVP